MPDLHSGTITIDLSLTETGDLQSMVTVPDGMPLYEALGHLEMAKDSLLNGPDDD